MKQWISVIFLILAVQALTGQEVSDTEKETENLWLELKNINFVKNNEYFNPITEGYTLIGYFIQPSVVYSPSKKVSIKLGGYFLDYAGTNKKLNPGLVFSTTYYISENTFLTMGTLGGSDSHRMVDPHFNKERLYNYYTENGLQFVTENNRFFSDSWINWENFIFRGDTVREEFTVGESFRYSFRSLSNGLKLELPVQFQFKHYGGQISNYESHVITYFNLSAGLKLCMDINNGNAGMAGVEYIHFIFNELRKNGDAGITNGYASWIRLHYNFRNFYFGTYYWLSDNFFAPNGNPIYSSISEIDHNIIISRRSIWTTALQYRVKPLNYFELYLGFDAYYDLDLKQFDTSVALHLYFSKLISLSSSRRR